MKTLFKGPPPASRPKSQHQSIRGKISGPIPIPSPLEEEEFPIRNPGTGIASPTPLDENEAEEHRQRQLQPPATGTSIASGVTASQAEVPQATVPEPPSSPPPAPPSGPSPTSAAGGSTVTGPESSPSQRSPKRHRTNPSSTLRYSTVSNVSTDSPAHQNGRPERKKSTLRGALSKLFGRKKKEGSQGSVSTTERLSALGGASQHRSDPAALATRSKDTEPKRSASLPITEFDRALRSHSVGPNDITAIESARNSIQADASPSRRRAATISSRVFLGPRRGDLGEWAGLSPRPASTHGRSSRLLTGDEDPSEIGRAITSDSTGDLSHKRRSRSLSGLHDIASRGTDSRRRSDEIRYWRESYDPGFLSPLSSGPNDGTDIGDDNDDTGQVSVSAPESPVVERPPKTPPQPFNFGSLASMNEMAGMKITQAASIDMRFGGLEGRMLKVERVVDQLCHSVPGFKGPFVELGSERSRSGPTSEPSFVYTSAAPPMIPAVYQTVSNELKGSSRYSSSRHSVETDAHSHMSFGEGQTYIGSLHPPSSSATQAQSITVTSGPTQLTSANRPTSTSTVRGATSLPTMGGAREQIDDASILQSQLEAERAARQALEAQVKKLSERLNLLSSTMFAMVRDPAKSKSQERLRPDTNATTPAPTPSPTGLTSVSIPVPAGKAQSVFEDDDDDGSTVAKEGDDYSEAFQTPREESGPTNYGAFGEELKDDDDDPKRKKAARTLSLSQLTMGKGVSTRI